MPATADDVLEGMRRRWVASHCDTVAGRFCASRPPAAEAMPFTLATVGVGAREDMTGQSYLQAFNVTLETRSVEGSHNRSAIERALTRAFDWQQKMVTVPTCARLVHLKPLTDQRRVVTAPEQYQGRDVKITALSWEVLLEQWKLR